MTNIKTGILLAVLALAALTLAATTPIDRIMRGAGRVVVNSNGSVSVTNPSGTSTSFNRSVVFSGIAAPSLSAAGTGKIYYDSSANAFKYSANGGAFANLIGAGSGDMILASGQTVTGAKTFTDGTLLLNGGDYGAADGSLPGSPVEKAFYLNTNSSSRKLFIYNGAAFHEIFQSGISGPISGANGGTNNAFMQFTGPTTSIKTFTLPNASATLSYTVASGTSALGTSAISSGACATAVTTTATGTATTDVISWGFNGDPTAVTGYVASANGMLTIIAYPSANNVNFKICNNTASSITPGAITLNWRVAR